MAVRLAGLCRNSTKCFANSVAEWLYAGFLTAGYLKADPRLAWIQDRVDLTILLFALSVLFALPRLFSRGMPIRFVRVALLFLILLGCLIAGLLRTASTGYGLSKVTSFVILTGWAFFGVPFLVTSVASLRRFAWALVTISAAMAVDAMTACLGPHPRRFLSAFGSNYIALARASGLGLLTITSFLLRTQRRTMARFGMGAIAVLQLWAGLRAGARGPVLAFVLAVLLFFALSIRGFPVVRVDRFALQLACVVLLVVVLLLPVASELFSTVVSRTMVLVTRLGTSVTTRIRLFRAAAGLWAESPLWGIGVGQFGLMVAGVDARFYPHNIVLELGVETGLIGVLALSMMVTVAVTGGRHCLLSREGVAKITGKYLLVAFSFLAVNAMVSGDINDNRMLFTFIALLALSERLCRHGTNDNANRQEPLQQRAGSSSSGGANKVTVVHLTTAHPALDPRIFHKEVRTLTEAGYRVTLIAQYANDAIIDRVKIIALPRPKNRFERIFGLTLRALRLALRQQANLYHYHDPELLPVGALLKLITGARVLYDVHEDVKKQILNKAWLPRWSRRMVSWIYGLCERVCLMFVDGVVIAEDSYTRNFPGRRNVTAIRNYPLLSYFGLGMTKGNTAAEQRPSGNCEVIYIGGITRLRGAVELIEALRILRSRGHDKVRLHLVGPLMPTSLGAELECLVRRYHLQDRVSIPGPVPHDKVAELLREAHIGVAVLHPDPNYVESLPTKLFEYMAAGVPVVASNFPLWKQIVEGNECGIVVDPRNPNEIADAIGYLLANPDKARQMGENGRSAVNNRYTWDKERDRLLELYRKLCSLPQQEHGAKEQGRAGTR